MSRGKLAARHSRIIAMSVWLNGLLVASGAVILAMAGRVSWRRSRLRRQRERLTRARDTFHRRREWLEAEFLTQASRSGKPRGLQWVNCDFDNAVTFARDRQTGDLRALVGVTISFAAVEGGGMEHVEAVGNLRAATAVFRYGTTSWTTDGRAVFNLTPNQTIERFGHELEPVG